MTKRLLLTKIMLLATLCGGTQLTHAAIIDLTGNGGFLGREAVFSNGGIDVIVTAVTRATSFADPPLSSFINQDVTGLGVAGGFSDVDNFSVFAEILSFSLSAGRVAGVEIKNLSSSETVLIGASAAANIAFPLDFLRVDFGDDLTDPDFIDIGDSHAPGRFLHVGINQALGPNALPRSRFRVSGLHVVVPEPSAVVLMTLGLVGLLASRRRSRSPELTR